MVKIERSSRCAKIAAIVTIISIIVSITVPVGLTFGWYKPCMAHNHRVTCTITNCTFTPDYNPGITDYIATVTYKYPQLNLQSSYEDETFLPENYCLYHRAINSTIDCYYDDRDLTTLSNVKDNYCQEDVYLGIMIPVLFISLPTCYLALAIAMGCAPV